MSKKSTNKRSNEEYRINNFLFKAK